MTLLSQLEGLRVLDGSTITETERRLTRACIQGGQQAADSERELAQLEKRMETDRSFARFHEFSNESMDCINVMRQVRRKQRDFYAEQGAMLSN
jgi:hypothetical protein